MRETYEQWEQRYRRSTESRNSYAAYLQSLNWDYIVTVTFRKARYDGIKTLESVWSSLHNDCFTKRAFLATENHRYPGSVHVHGLVSDYDGKRKPNMVLPWQMWDSLFRRFGRTTVDPVRSQADVTSYCSKYVTKALSNYGFYGQPGFWDK